MEKLKILIASDGMHSIEEKIHDLKRAGLPDICEALVFSVVDDYIPPVPAYAELGLSLTSVNYMEAQREIAAAQVRADCKKTARQVERAVMRLQTEFPAWTIRGETEVGSPVQAITQKEDEWKPDLLVLVSHSHSATARFLLGSVSRGIALHSKTTVRVVRKSRKAAATPIRIVLGVDGSPDAQMAVHVVAARRWPAGSSVRLVAAFDQRMSSAMAFHYFPDSCRHSKSDRGEKAAVKRMMEPFKERLERAGLKVTEKVTAGKPWKVLTQEAAAWKADSIVLGARGMGAVARLLLGSVSETVALRAQCSVEIVRRQP